MAKDYKYSLRPTRRRRSSGVWAGFLVGTAVSLIAAFVVYWSFFKPAADLRAGPAPMGKGVPGNNTVQLPASSQATAGGEKPAKPRFEFYTILPEREVQVPEPEINPRRKRGFADTNSPSSHYVLQVGSFREHSQADRLKANLALLGLEAEIQTVSVNGGETWHRVRLGPFTDLEILDKMRTKLRENSIEPMVLKIKT